MLEYDRQIIRAFNAPPIDMRIGDLVAVSGYSIVWKVVRVFRRCGLIRLFDGGRYYQTVPEDCRVLKRRKP